MKRRLRRLRSTVLIGLILSVSTSLVRVIGWTVDGERRPPLAREGGMWRACAGMSRYWTPRLRDALGYLWRARQLRVRP